MKINFTKAEAELLQMALEYFDTYLVDSGVFFDEETERALVRVSTSCKAKLAGEYDGALDDIALGITKQKAERICREYFKF